MGSIPTGDTISMNAGIDIEIAVACKQRMNAEPFRPTKTWSDVYQYKTDLTNHRAVVESIASEIWNHTLGLTGGGIEFTLYIQVGLANVTHDPVAKGVVPLPKGHRSTAMTDIEFSTVASLQNHLNNVIANLQQTAKY